ncbi:hypothetical protein [Granulicella paludicola]|uniref:hypothetical protein n=1 Tax=Granulicella paludicola TaxID=474951 RepID=UPI0021DFE57A|nr:hypothetical protein [Granulicella paludicola]
MTPSRPYRLIVKPVNHRALAIIALAHLVLFQLFLFANTDYAIAESIRGFCHNVLR